MIANSNMCDVILYVHCILLLCTLFVTLSLQRVGGPSDDSLSLGTLMRERCVRKRKEYEPGRVIDASPMPMGTWGETPPPTGLF
jgi:hypothetical protein